MWEEKMLVQSKIKEVLSEGQQRDKGAEVSDKHQGVGFAKE